MGLKIWVGLIGGSSSIFISIKSLYGYEPFKERVYGEDPFNEFLNQNGVFPDRLYLLLFLEPLVLP